MGHLKMKAVGAPLIPAPTKLSLRMTPAGTGGRFQLGAAAGTITGGLSCVPFLSLATPSIENPGATGTPGLWRYTLPVDGDTETCGECIEWVLTEMYDALASGATEPEVTIYAAEDCKGLIVDVQFPEGYETIEQSWIFAMRPFINGQRFAFDTGFGIEIHVAGATCFEYVSSNGSPSTATPGGWLYPAGEDWSIEMIFTGAVSGVFAWNPSETGSPPSDPIDVVEDTDGFGRPRITYTYTFTGGDRPEDGLWAVQMGPSIDDVPTYGSEECGFNDGFIRHDDV